MTSDLYRNIILTVIAAALLIIIGQNLVTPMPLLAE